MRRYLAIAVTIMMVSVFTGSSFASEPVRNKASIEKGEVNLIKSLENSNYGVRTSAAQILGDLKCTKAVIPLMKMVKSSEDEKTRIVAALALYKIGTDMGLFTVAQAATFDESARVRKLCANFYRDHYQKDLNTIPSVNSDSVVSIK